MLRDGRKYRSSEWETLWGTTFHDASLRGIYLPVLRTHKISISYSGSKPLCEHFNSILYSLNGKANHNLSQEAVAWPFVSVCALETPALHSRVRVIIPCNWHSKIPIVSIFRTYSLALCRHTRPFCGSLSYLMQFCFGLRFSPIINRMIDILISLSKLLAWVSCTFSTISSSLMNVKPWLQTAAVHQGNFAPKPLGKIPLL